MENFLESFNRTKLLIKYDVSKTATENVFFEQVSTVDTSLRQGKVSPSTVNNPDYSGYDVLNPFNPNYGKKEVRNLDTHDWFSLVQLALLAGGFASGGATAVVAFALEAVVSFAEAIVFFVKDDDPYMGTVMAILSVLGLDDLKRIPVIKKYGIEGTAQLLKKGKEGLEKLTKEEIEDLRILKNYIVSNAGEIIPLFKNGIKKQVLKYLSKKSSKYLLNVLYLIDKGKYPLFIAGTWIPFDYLYIYVYKDDIAKMKLRNENIFVQIVQWVENKLGEKKTITSEEILENIKKRGIDYSTIKAPSDSVILSNSEQIFKDYGIK
jgi:hypothetical protein